MKKNFVIWLVLIFALCYLIGAFSARPQTYSVQLLQETLGKTAIITMNDYTDHELTYTGADYKIWQAIINNADSLCTDEWIECDEYCDSINGYYTPNSWQDVDGCITVQSIIFYFEDNVYVHIVEFEDEKAFRVTVGQFED